MFNVDSPKKKTAAALKQIKLILSTHHSAVAGSGYHHQIAMAFCLIFNLSAIVVESELNVCASDFWL